MAGRAAQWVHCALASSLDRLRLNSSQQNKSERLLDRPVNFHKAAARRLIPEPLGGQNLAD